MSFPPGPAGEPGTGRRRWLRPLLAAALAVGVTAVAADLFFQGLGAAPLAGDEAIHAQVAREMAERDDWLPPTLEGRPYTAKPPLKILAVAWIFDRFGVSELHARVLDAGLGVATVLLVFLFGLRCFGPWSGALAALLLATDPFYVLRHGVRDGVQDAALDFFVTAGLMLYAHRLSSGRRGWVALAGAGVAIGLGSLVKGAAAAAALPVLVAWELVLGRRRGGLAAGARDLAVVAVLALAAYIPYGAAATAWTDGGFGAILYRDVVVRATASVDPAHVRGAGFYLAQLRDGFGFWLLAALPALAVLAARGRGGSERTRTGLVLCALWGTVLLVLFSLSTSKLAWYLYPAYPAFVLCFAGGTGAAVRWATRRRAERGPAAAVLATALVALAVAGAWQRHGRLTGRLEAEPRKVRIVRYAEAVEASPGYRLAIAPGTLVAPQHLFYLWPLGHRSRATIRSYRRQEPEGCRYLVRGWPELPRSMRPAAHARALPLEWPEPQAWLLDLDGCLPSWL